MNADFASWHDRDMRELAAELIGKGAGWRTLTRGACNSDDDG